MRVTQPFAILPILYERMQAFDGPVYNPEVDINKSDKLLLVPPGLRRLGRGLRRGHCTHRAGSRVAGHDETEAFPCHDMEYGLVRATFSHVTSDTVETGTYVPGENEVVIDAMPASATCPGDGEVLDSGASRTD